MDIIDIFYNQIIKEATKKQINSYGKSNIVFSTIIKEDNIYYEAEKDDENLIIPTLIIKDKNKFNNLLKLYVEKAKLFYNDINDLENLYEVNENDNKEKFIMTRLWANATFEDFQDPINFLVNRINFFDTKLKFDSNYLYSSILKSTINVNLEKDIIDNETPYKLKTTLTDDNNNYIELPSVKIGISNDKAYIYAIQKENKIDFKERHFGKMINRALYKTKEGFDESTDNYELYDSGNLKDITPSFLLVANICMKILEQNGINEIIIPSILIERYNSRNIKYNHIKTNKLDNTKDKEIIYKEYEDNIESNDNIQTNLTEKLLRTFRRLVYHHSNMDITSYPSELDTSLHIKFNHTKDICNNKLLDETYNVENNSNKTK